MGLFLQRFKITEVKQKDATHFSNAWGLFSSEKKEKLFLLLKDICTKEKFFFYVLRTQHKVEFIIL